MNYPIKGQFVREIDYERALKLYTSFPDRFEILNAGLIDDVFGCRYEIEFLDHYFDQD